MCRIDYCENSFVIVYFFPEIDSSHLLTPINCLSDVTQKSDEQPREIPQVVITRFLTTNVILSKKSTKFIIQDFWSIFPYICTIANFDSVIPLLRKSISALIYLIFQQSYFQSYFLIPLCINQRYDV